MHNEHDKLDKFKLLVATEILAKFSLRTIRAHSLANLDQWNSNDVWCTAHDEWRALMKSGSDQAVTNAMTDLEQKSNRLRQSPPYVGLLSQERRRELLIEAGLSPAPREAIEKAAILLAEGKLD